MANYNWKTTSDPTDDATATTGDATTVATPSGPGGIGSDFARSLPPARPPAAPASSPGGNWNPLNWEWRSPPGGTILPPPGPTAGFDKSIGQNLDVLGQGGTDIAHGIYNYERSAANYATGGWADRGLGDLNLYLPAGTPAALRPNPYDWQAAQTQQARNEMGPGMDTLAMLTGLRGFSRLAGPAAEEIAGRSVLNPAVQGGLWGTLKGSSEPNPDPKKEAAGIPDPVNTGLNALGYGTLGLGSGILVNKGIAPVLNWATKKYYGGTTPESVAANLNQTATNTEQQSAAQEEAAKQTLNERLSNLRIPSKALGFTVEGQTDPSVLTTQGYRDWLASQDPKNVAGPVDVAKINARYAGPTHLYGEGTEGQRQFLKNQAITGAGGYVPPHNLPTATQRMMDSINQQLSNPSVAGPTAAAQAEADAATATAQNQATTARTTANTAEELASAARRTGMPGQNVPAEYAAKLAQPGLTPAQIQTYQNIAQSGVPGKGPALWQAIGKLIGGTAGSALGPVGTVVGAEGGGAALRGFAAGPTGAAATQRALATAWPDLMPGVEWPASARAAAAASEAVQRLYGLK